MKIDTSHELGKYRATYYRVVDGERTIGSFAMLIDALAFADGHPRPISIYTVDHYENAVTEQLSTVVRPLENR